ncbi:MAG: proline--tRNA ligase [Leptospirales bacterium]|nr:proline--tRNA ligase [Leptospirales bacterium]
MRASRFLIHTLRDTPADAVIASHRWMLRAGLIGKLGSGLYHLLPMGLRAFRKVENIIRDEMNKAGAVEFILPVLIPGELWEKSGRWKTMGKEMFRLQDRHETWNVLGPTHEESFTELMKGILKSYRDLPVNVYQIHTKFRDEIRPRFGVMRSREFVMKDAYSFHKDQASLEETYQKMRTAYRNIFSRLGLETIPVQADTGTMGGSASEEFMVPSEVGEETLLISEGGKYQSNQEKTPFVPGEAGDPPAVVLEKKKLHTPGASSIEDVAKLLGVDAVHLAKAMLFQTENGPALVFIRGDRQINEVKLKNALDGAEFRPASEAEAAALGFVPGFMGPSRLPADLRIIRDASLRPGRAYIAGAGERDYHEGGVVFDDSYVEKDVALAVAGDLSPMGDGKLRAVKGIEVGHIFQLGNKYSKAFNVSVLDETGRPLIPTMGCYGIGVQRTLAAVIEQNHDEKGIKWPVSASPFEVVLVSITRSEEEETKVETLHQLLENAGFEVLWDDRDLRPGVKFADAEVIGYPVRVTAGKNFFESGKLELQVRATGQMLEATPEDLVSTVGRLLGRPSPTPGLTEEKRSGAAGASKSAGRAPKKSSTAGKKASSKK